LPHVAIRRDGAWSLEPACPKTLTAAGKSEGEFAQDRAAYILHAIEAEKERHHCKLMAEPMSELMATLRAHGCRKRGITDCPAWRPIQVVDKEALEAVPEVRDAYFASLHTTLDSEDLPSLDLPLATRAVRRSGSTVLACHDCMRRGRLPVSAWAAEMKDFNEGCPNQSDLYKTLKGERRLTELHLELAIVHSLVKRRITWADARRFLAKLRYEQLVARSGSEEYDRLRHARRGLNRRWLHRLMVSLMGMSHATRLKFLADEREEHHRSERAFRLTIESLSAAAEDKNRSASERVARRKLAVTLRKLLADDATRLPE
jgi:hypothetical protein